MRAEEIFSTLQRNQMNICQFARSVVIAATLAVLMTMKSRTFAQPIGKKGKREREREIDTGLKSSSASSSMLVCITISCLMRRIKFV